MLSPRRVFWRTFLLVLALPVAAFLLALPLGSLPVPGEPIAALLSLPLVVLFGAAASLAPKGWFGGNVVAQPLGIAGWLWASALLTLFAAALAGVLAGVRAIGWRVANRTRFARRPSSRRSGST